MLPKSSLAALTGLLFGIATNAAEVTLTVARGGDNAGEIITNEAFPEYRFNEKMLTHTAAQLLQMTLPQAGVDFDPVLVNAQNETLSDEARLQRVMENCSDLVLDIHFDAAFAPKTGSGLVIYTLNPEKATEQTQATAQRAENLGNAILKSWQAAGKTSNGDTVHYADTPLLRNPACPTLLINLDSNLDKKSTWFISPQSIMYRMQTLSKAIGAATQ